MDVENLTVVRSLISNLNFYFKKQNLIVRDVTGGKTLEPGTRLRKNFQICK